MAGQVEVSPPRIGLVSNVTGRLAGAGYGTAQYWVEHVRKPVRFADSVQTAETLGARVFIEVGPSGGLTGLVEQSLTEEAASATLLAKDRPEVDSLLTAMGRLFAQGVAVDWRGAFAGLDVQRVELPTYGFTRRRFWLNKLGAGPAIGWRGFGGDWSCHCWVRWWSGPMSVGWC